MVNAIALISELIVVGFSVLISTACFGSRLAKVRLPFRVGLVAGMIFLVGGVAGVLWCFLSPPPFSQRVPRVGPASRRNDPYHSIYFGNGCFWHTQYDMVVLEQDTEGPFGGRPDAQVTSLVGYAGGNWASPGGGGGKACYHGTPGTDYGRLGHAEAVSVELAHEPATALAQIAALSKLYFEHGFQSRPCRGANDLGCVLGPTGWQRRQRLDPQDAGPMYRNVIGFPGGMGNSTLLKLIELANVHAMPLVLGAGGPSSDLEGEYVVYIYDSLAHPFYRAEATHQFHANDVVRRYVPPSYTRDLKATQTSLGRMDGHGCVDPPGGFMLSLVWPALVSVPLGVGMALLWRAHGALGVRELKARDEQHRRAPRERERETTPSPIRVRP